ncbi:MAG TPA: hypothetical protein VFK72_04635, partial [Nevskia sp.]|nr:hypothetical protein [Nevskia sp.]
MLVLAVLCFAGRVFAQESNSPPEYNEEWGNRIKMAEAIGPLGTNLFGDSINYYNGQTTFSATDIDLKGNNGLAVRLARTHVTSEQDGIAAAIQIDGWDLDLPYLSGVY